MKFSNDAARKRALTLTKSGTYVEGRYFGEAVVHAAHFARALAVEYGRDVQVVERVVVRPEWQQWTRRPPSKLGVAVLATCTADGSVFT
jgi:hypothetical protein